MIQPFRAIRPGVSASLLALAAGCLIHLPAAAQEDLETVPAVPRDYKPAQTAWGEPDFRGGWPIDHLNGRTPLERDPKYGKQMFLSAEEFAEKEGMVGALEQRYQNEDTEDRIGIGHWAEMGVPSRRTSFIIDPPDGRMPERTEEGARLSKLMRSTWRQGQDFDTPEDFDSWDRCITRGLPASMFPFMYNNGMRIFQAPGLVALQMEMVHETRLIYTDGRPAVPSQLHNWLGESRGRWEDGNTLVIETSNFRPGPSATNIGTTGSPRANDTPVSEQAHMTERLTMIDADSITYEMTWDDPGIFTGPWTARLDWKRDEEYGIFEYACHEGNVQIRNYISSSRAQRAKASNTGE